MAEVATAIGAVDLCPRHAIAPIDRRRDRTVFERLGETRPSRTALELRRRIE
jgi:hypothetical protein